MRSNALFKIVVEEGLGILHHWRRYEFAKSRGTIHFHALLWSKEASDAMQQSLKKVHEAIDETNLIEIENEVMEDIVEAIEEKLFKLTAEHPAGRKRSRPEMEADTDWWKGRWKVAQICQKIKESEYEPTLEEEQFMGKYIVGHDDAHADHIGNYDQWPGPEGGGADATSTPLRRKVSEIPLNSPQSILKDSINYTNRVKLHVCSSYCLRTKMVGDQPITFCKQHFGEMNPDVVSVVILIL
jgi:hypothetical protein